MLVLSLIFTGSAFAVNADKLFNDGNALVKKGDFPGAYKAYTEASKAAPEKREYAASAMLMRRVIILKKYADTQPVSTKWEKVVISLHAFYLSNSLLDEALALDKDAHNKLNNALSTSLLSETYLEMNENKKTIKVLSKLDKKKFDTQNWLCLAIALARTGKVNDAKKIQAKHLSGKIDNPGLLFDSARLNSLVGNADEAYRLLTTCFEQTPANKISDFKKSVIACPDFKQISKTPRFGKVLQTRSKIKFSSCSGSSSCGFPSKKGGCSKAKNESSVKHGGCPKNKK